MGVRVYSLLPKTLTLFMPTVCDFSFLIYDLTKNLMSFFMTVAASTVLSIMIKKSLLIKKRQDFENHILFMTKMAKILFMTKMVKIDTLYVTKTAEKPYPLGHTYPYSSYMVLLQASRSRSYPCLFRARSHYKTIGEQSSRALGNTVDSCQSVFYLLRVLAVSERSSEF